MHARLDLISVCPVGGRAVTNQTVRRWKIHGEIAHCALGLLLLLLATVGDARVCDEFVGSFRRCADEIRRRRGRKTHAGHVFNAVPGGLAERETVVGQQDFKAAFEIFVGALRCVECFQMCVRVQLRRTAARTATPFYV
jgi:hypothetical protein